MYNIIESYLVLNLIHRFNPVLEINLNVYLNVLIYGLFTLSVINSGHQFRERKHKLC